MKFKLYFFVFFFIFLTGCSPVKLNETTYTVDTIPCNVPKTRMHPVTLMVLQPDNAAAFNTSQMAYTKKPYEIAYFVENRWIDTPGQMLQPLIVQTLQRTHHYRAVVTPPFIGSYDYILNTQILEFEQDYTHCLAFFKVKIAAQLVKISTNQIIASRQFCATRPICPQKPYYGVIAANMAVSEVLEDLAEFVVERT